MIKSIWMSKIDRIKCYIQFPSRLYLIVFNLMHLLKYLFKLLLLLISLLLVYLNVKNKNELLKTI